MNLFQPQYRRLSCVWCPCVNLWGTLTFKLDASKSLGESHWSNIQYNIICAMWLCNYLVYWAFHMVLVLHLCTNFFVRVLKYNDRVRHWTCQLILGIVVKRAYLLLMDGCSCQAEDQCSWISLLRACNCFYQNTKEHSALPPWLADGHSLPPEAVVLPERHVQSNVPGPVFINCA